MMAASVGAPGGGPHRALDGDLGTHRRTGSDEIETDVIQVPDKIVGSIIGKGGERIKRLQRETGAKIKMDEDSRGIPYRKFLISGARNTINHATEMIMEIVSHAEGLGDWNTGVGTRMGGPMGLPDIEDGSGSLTIEISIPGNKVGLVIGKGGETIKHLQIKSGTKIVIINDGPLQEKEKLIRITGEPQKVEKAKKMINNLIADKKSQAAHSGNRGRGQIKNGDSDYSRGNRRDYSRERDEYDGDWDPESVLASFRKEWKSELESGSGLSSGGSSVGGSVAGSLAASGAPSVRSSPSRTDPTLPSTNVHSTLEDIRPDVEQQASELFNKGVALEQSGRLYEAIQFYRKAMTLVPDIEFRVHRRNNIERKDGHCGSLTDATNVTVSTQENEEEEEEDDDDMSDLINRFTRLTSGSAAVCDKKYEQGATHISCLPPEMLERIMCWLIGTGLDLQALEQVGNVCRGFYMIARNPELWHRACLRVWGIKCGPVGSYGSWRNMFIERPHPRYNGCYISCTTYFRFGENNFRDQNYQPWHVVRYYRYIRFFPEGKVLMLTCADDPKVSTGILKNKEVKSQQVLQGNYRIHDSNISLLFKRSSRQKMKNKKKIRGLHIGTTDVQETTFQIEFEIGSVKNNRNWQLLWRDYTIISVYQDERQSVSKPSINDINSFPHLKFSGVKSYNLENEEPLM